MIKFYNFYTFYVIYKYNAGINYTTVRHKKVLLSSYFTGHTMLVNNNTTINTRIMLIMIKYYHNYDGKNDNNINTVSKAYKMK
jgi:hypothetical protein